MRRRHVVVVVAASDAAAAAVVVVVVIIVIVIVVAVVTVIIPIVIAVAGRGIRRHRRGHDREDIGRGSSSAAMAIVDIIILARVLMVYHGVCSPASVVGVGCWGRGLPLVRHGDVASAAAEDGNWAP
mgnify:CR=1 FL=1